MVLMGKVPATIIKGLAGNLDNILCGQKIHNIEHWAVHPGGRTVLDAVQKSFDLSSGMLRQSRDILRRFGNMSSATVMFVLKEMMQPETKSGRGCAMAFGPGLTAESLLFQTS
jgi:predicted naringenin-chalcone synthase